MDKIDKESTITIKYTWDERLAITSAKEIYEYELKNSNKKYIGWLFVALAQFGVVGALKHNAYGLLVISSLGILYWYGFRWDIRKFFISKSFKKSPFKDKVIQLEADEKGIFTDGKELLLYKDIIKSEQLENAIVIYHKLGTTYIPNNAFESKSKRVIFKKYLKLVN